MSKDLNIIKQFESADKEEFKRPNHSDFMDSSELKKAKFSGVRINQISQSQELWIEGEVKISLSLFDADFRSEWNRRYSEVLGLCDVETVSQKGN